MRCEKGGLRRERSFLEFKGGCPDYEEKYRHLSAKIGDLRP